MPSRARNQWLNVTYKNNSITGYPVSINNRIYCTLSMIIYLLNTINPNHTFIEKFNKLLKKYKTIDVASMGFTKEWKDEPLWRGNST
jgi:abortive infection bacteriophage resistance protein